MIEIKNLRKAYDDQVIFEDFNLTVGKEIVGLIGANGTGKTTLFKCILGLIEFQGQITMSGINVAKHPLKAHKEIGYIPQYLPLWNEITVYECVQFFCNLRKVNLKRGLELLDFFDLKKHQKKSISTLSGGMRQKLSIAIALIPDPPILLLDEPTANLDAWATKEVISTINDWRGKKVVLFASHRIEEIVTISDRLVQISEGKAIHPNLDELKINERRTTL